MELPRAVLGTIVYDDESWDEAHIGYWCRFHRSPDIYHAGLWRLLQAPYYRTSDEPLRSNGSAVTRNSVIAEVLERLGEPADRILRRHGLFCVGCTHSAADTLYRGALAHGLDDQRIDRLTAELARLEAARG
jgi:CMP-N-acetylneuraminate monooxygenase